MGGQRALLTSMLAPLLDVPPETLEAVQQHMRPVSFDAGAIMYRQGEVAQDIILLSGGLVRAYHIHEGREVNLRLLCAPAVATAMSSRITGEPSKEWVAAITPVQGFRADPRGLLQQDNGLWAERLGRILAEQHYLALERRLHMLQWKSVAERYAFFCEHMPADIVEQTPGYHIASYLAVTPETLSRARRKAQTS
jgi:CRP-like cAMP-binding protein